MFIGAINSTLRQFLANNHSVFADRRVVVGCSGNFTSEATLTQFSNPLEIHSNDVSLYSCMLGSWLSGQPFEFEIADADYGWLAECTDTLPRAIASVMILLEMLKYEKQNNEHRVRMWGLYRESFPQLVAETTAKLLEARIRVTSFYAGDVLDHFRRFADDEDTIFCCYAPTYTGGYERMYKRLGEIIRWDEPEYPMLDDERRSQLLAWMAERNYLWYDDRLLDGHEPVLKQNRGLQRTVYLYSNVIPRPALFAEYPEGELPELPLAPSGFEMTDESVLTLKRIKTSDMSRFKDVYLSKKIAHAAGTWAFAVLVDGWVVGFFEYAMPKSYASPDALYLMSDFPVSGTRYERLSKLIVMTAISGETCQMMERIREYRVRQMGTTAFTDRPVSMKYRGVLNLAKRGETDDGRKYLNYEQVFNDQTWQEVLQTWWTKHGSKTH